MVQKKLSKPERQENDKHTIKTKPGKEALRCRAPTVAS